MREIIKVALVSALVLLACPAARADNQIVLKSDSICVTIDAKTARVVGIDNVSSGESHVVKSDGCRVETDSGVIDLGAAKWAFVSANRLADWP